MSDLTTSPHYSLAGLF